MANNVFNIKNDFAVEFYIPTTGNWIWGVSLWDGGDVWSGSSTVAWQDLHCEIVAIDNERGCETDMGVIVSAPIQRSQIVLNTSTYDPFTHGTIHAGTPVRIRYRPYPDTSPTTYTTMFTGTVEAFSTSYDANGNSIVTLSCVDPIQGILNTTVATQSVVAGTSPFSLIASLFLVYGGLTVSKIYLQPDIVDMAIKTYTNVTVGEIVRDCLIAGQGALWVSAAGDVKYMSAADLNQQTSAVVFDFSTIHSTDQYHVCMSDLQMLADSRQLPTEIIATLTTGSVMTLRNQDAYQLYGAVSYAVNVPVDNTTMGQTWLNNLDLTAKLRRVQSLSFPAIQRAGQLFYYHRYGDALFSSVQQVTNTPGRSNFSNTYFINKQKNTILRQA